MLGLDRSPIMVHAQHIDPFPRKVLPELLLSDQDARLRIFENGLQTPLGICRVKRNVCPTSLQNSQNPHEEIDRAIYTESDQDFGTDTMLAQACGKSIRTPVQFLI